MTPLYLDAAWTMLSVHLARHLQAVAVPEPTRARNAFPAGRLARVLTYVEEHVSDPGLRVSDLASLAGLSPVQFTRLFTRAVGESPMQHVIGLRLDRAREVLARNEISITQLAMDAGFGSHARFSEAFRRRFGVTPSQCRGPVA